jgi:hypothetical protein
MYLHEFVSDVVYGESSYMSKVHFYMKKSVYFFVWKEDYVEMRMWVLGYNTMLQISEDYFFFEPYQKMFSLNLIMSIIHNEKKKFP